jgi:hypothetical protein
MLATVIKNTILIFFVICIGYFLVDNHLNEMRLESGYDNKINKKHSDVSNFLKEVKAEANTVNKDNKDTKNNTKDDNEGKNETPTSGEPKNMRIVIDSELKELYNYVFNDMKASDDLTSMFTKTEVKTIETDHQILCESNQKEDKKIENMCYDPITNHHKEVSYNDIESKGVIDQSVYDFVDKHI